jgi:hypothetical protein
MSSISMAFRGVGEDRIRHACADRRWRVRVQQKLDQGGGGGRSSLLESSDGLAEGGSTRFPVGLLEIGDLQPTQKRPRANSRCPGRLLDIALG